VERDALRRVTPFIRTFAEVEGLAEHGRSVALREDAS
jgi:histidinol dehydrogenase